MVSTIPEHASVVGPGLDPLAHYVLNEKRGERVLSRILIASNGLAAVKAIRSIRRWEVLEVLKSGSSERALSFVSMATPEDIEANAQFLQMVDSFVEVPGGKNTNNYANVELITKIAVEERVDAVWPGWGHASEKPELPESLAKHGIVFLGPESRVMQLLGDKIYANIMAQTANVPCIPWSGDGLQSKESDFSDLDALFKKACCANVDEAVAQANRIGYPVMLKASEGGGGKGIRKCVNAEEVVENFRLCELEVVGSPIFIMKYSSGSCHLEVQLLGDKHGNVCALSGRDCSTQRRFQKIFEEGPPTVADPDVFYEMQMAAKRLAEQVGYTGAGTVEFLYDPSKHKYYFLELNPRLQVEHPVTECITGVNIPAAQLQIGMGMSLQDITDIRRYYLKGLDTDASPSNNKNGKSGRANTSKEWAHVVVDFTRKVPMDRHCIAARITAENPEDGFLPCSGNIRKIDFVPTHESVWGYFSVATPGAVHEFADSQFGHLFSVAPTRDQARKALILSLGQLQVEGDIRNTIDVLSKLLRCNRFVNNQVDTAWLDGLIQTKAISKLMMNIPGGALGNEDIMSQSSDEGATTSRMANRYSLLNDPELQTINSDVSSEVSHQQQQSKMASSVVSRQSLSASMVMGRFSPELTLSSIMNCEDFVFYAALVKTLNVCSTNQKSLLDMLSKGQVVNNFSSAYVQPEVTIVWNQISYSFHITRISEEVYVVRSRDDFSECIAHVKEHKESLFIRVTPVSEGLIDINGAISTKPVKVVPQVESLGIRLRIGAMMGSEVFLPNVTDPSELRSDVQGKMIRFLVSEGDWVKEGQVCCELEAMKMIVPVKAKFEGKVSGLIAGVNSVIGAGDLLLKFSNVGEAPPDDDCSISGKEVAKVADSSAASRFVIRKYAELARGRKLFSSPGKGGKIMQPAKAVIRGFPKLGQFRLPDSPEEAADLIKDFLENEKYFIAQNASAEVILHGLLQTLSTEEVYKIFLKKSHLNHRIAVILDVVTKFNSKLLVLSMNLVKELANLPERYGELVLRSSRLLRENARNYVNLNQIQRGKEWIELSMASDRVLNGAEGERLMRSAEAPETKTCIGVIHALEEMGTSDDSENRTKNSLSRSLFPSNENIAGSLNAFKLRSKALECLIYRAYRGYDNVQVGEEIVQAGRNLGPLSARRFQYAYPGGGQGLSGFGNLIPPRHGLALVVSSVSSLCILFESGLKKLLLGNRSKTATMPIDEMWLLFVGESAAPQRVCEMCVATVNSCYDSLKSLDIRHISLTYTQGGGFNQFHFVRQETAFEPPERGAQRVNNVSNIDSSMDTSRDESDSGGTTLGAYQFVEDTLLRNLRPCYAHLLEVEKEMRSGFTRIGPELNSHCMVLLGGKQDLIEVRAVTYDGFTGSTVGSDESIEDCFFVPAESTLDTAIDELARAKLDPRVPKDIPAKIFVHLMTRLPVQPQVLMEHYQASILSSVSGFVKSLLKYRVDVIEFKLRLLSGENLRLTASSKGEYLQPAAYLEYLNPMTGLVTRSVDLAKMAEGTFFTTKEANSTESILEKKLQQKRTQAHKAGSTYVYDFPNLLRIALLEKRDAETGRENGRHSVTNTDVDSPTEDELATISGGDLGTSPTPNVAATSRSKYRKLISAIGGGASSVQFLAQEFVFDDANDGEDATSRKSVPRSSSLLQMIGEDGTIDANAVGKNISDTGIGFSTNIQALKSQVKKNKSQLGIEIAEAIEQMQELGLRMTDRPLAGNTIGMVAWLCVLKTQEHPSGRLMILIANDITHQAGSFGVQEDRMYQRASELARKLGLPRIYISANSGARVGLVEKLIEVVKPSFIPGSNPPVFEYWYLDKEGYAKHGADVESEKVICTSTGDEKYKITAITGGHGIGVENLKGSALIAGETSRAYNETFTLSFVTGRSVGIGAYVNRLGQRVIQQRQGPMILTGFSALNKLLGKQVYTSQDQLGGPQVMCPNGVTHLLVENDQEGCERILEWLSFIPRKRGESVLVGTTNKFEEGGGRSGVTSAAQTPKMLESPKAGAHQIFGTPTSLSQLAGAVTTPRANSKGVIRFNFWPVLNESVRMASNNLFDSKMNGGGCMNSIFTPTSTPYDPRLMLDGDQNLSGFFDKNSFTEVLSEWGKTIIVGRARLGGVPTGVIAVETRSVNRLVPADPANLESKITEEPQAGQVWFPDSAYKTATAIRDFQSEGLPLMIFANWRGFSGGTRDMFSEILKFGAQIVDALVAYENPVFVYIPPGGELRGGAWVVIDPSINPLFMEMYADRESRGGILEPAGIVDVKLREPTLLKLMHRMDPEIQRNSDDRQKTAKSLKSLKDESSGANANVSNQSKIVELESSIKKKEELMKKREELLLPLYTSMAVELADLHDRAPRMHKVGCIKKIVEWQNARQFFCLRMRRRVIECDYYREIQKTAGIKKEEAIKVFKTAVERVWFDQEACKGGERKSSGERSDGGDTKDKKGAGSKDANTRDQKGAALKDSNKEKKSQSPVRKEDSSSSNELITAPYLYKSEENDLICLTFLRDNIAKVEAEIKREVDDRKASEAKKILLSLDFDVRKRLLEEFLDEE